MPEGKGPEALGPSESLGRGVFSSKQAARSRRSGVPKRVFLERKGRTEISVDRLDFASGRSAGEIARGVAEERGQSFYGWAVIAAEDACRSGRSVRASPTAENPRHADILLPALAGEDYEEQIRHAQELADDSHWREAAEHD